MNDDDFERRLHDFELAWRQKPAEPSEFLAGLTGSRRRHLLLELICIDLERRWQGAAESQGSISPLTLEDYIRRFAELGDLDDLPLELLGEEYRARSRWGDKPTHAEFISRFNRRRDELTRLLKDADRESRDEQIDSSIAPRSNPVAVLPMPAAIDAPMPYSDFVLQRLIGAGRSGKVYRSWQRSLERIVAIKFLRKSFLADPVAVERFASEAKIMARMRHPSIVGVHGLGQTPSHGLFIVMDLIEGPDLARVVRSRQPSLPEAIRWTAEACSAIAHAHERGVVHCDLKPANLLLGSDGGMRLTDFGLARFVLDAFSWRGELEGTAPFMAPEQVDPCWGSVGVQTDVYGLGAVLYVLLTGRAPWLGRRLGDVLSQVVSAALVVPPRSIRPEIPEEFDRICRRCLAKAPAERYRTALELRAALLGLPQTR